jgi:hypothetical protein
MNLRHTRTFIARSILLGMAIEFLVCSMAAWDCSLPPQASAANVYGGGPCGFEEPIPLRLWRMPFGREQPEWRSQQCGSESGAADGDSWWQFRVGRGLCDYASVTALTPAPPSAGKGRADFGAFCRWSRMQRGSGDDAWPGQRGLPILWNRIPAEQREPMICRLPSSPPDLEPDSVIAAAARTGHVGRRVCETRTYGWPLRCLWVCGIREQEWVIEWTVDDFGEGAWSFTSPVRDNHWTDGLFGGARERSWSCDAELPPASGIPWRPLWLPLTANSLMLGMPSVGAATMFRCAVRRWIGAWRRARARRRGTCSACGYSLVASQDVGAAERRGRCPECGEHN